MADNRASLPPTSGSDGRRFRIHGCLGRGGFGEVYRATMESTGGVTTEVAVKVLRGDIDPGSEAVKRLRDEGRLLGKLSHPSILKVHDLVLLDGRVALVTEYIEGEDLEHCIHARPPMPLRPLVTALGEVASALDAAWRSPSPTTGEPLHLVHRDVKPANVRVGLHGEVKLLDFGIARATNVAREAQTAHDAMMGSYPYMAPERFHEDVVEPPSDVFSLGCILFEAVSGDRFYGGSSLKQVYATVASDVRYQRLLERQLAAIRSRVPGQVHKLVAALLAPSPEHRPTAAELAQWCEDLGDEVDGPTLKRWSRERHWGQPEVIAGSLDGLVLTAGSFSDGTNVPAPRRTSRSPEPAWNRTVPEMNAPVRSPVGGHPLLPAEATAPLGSTPRPGPTTSGPYGTAPSPYATGSSPYGAPPRPSASVPPTSIPNAPPAPIPNAPPPPSTPPEPSGGPVAPSPRPQPVFAGPPPSATDSGGPDVAVGGAGIELQSEPGFVFGDMSAARDDAEGDYQAKSASRKRRRRVQAVVIAGVLVCVLAVLVVVPASYFLARSLAGGSPGTGGGAAAVTEPSPIAAGTPPADPEAGDPAIEGSSEEAGADQPPGEGGAGSDETADVPDEPAPAPAPQPAPKPQGPTAGSLSARGWNTVSSDPAGAAELFRQALAMSPGYADAEYGLGYALMQQGDAEGGLVHLCRALEAGSGDIQRDVRSLVSRSGMSCE